MDMTRKNRITAIVIIVLSVFGLVEAKSYSAEAAAYPLVVLIMAIALSIILFFTKPRTQTKLKKIVFRQLIATILLTGAYYFSIKNLGYYFSTLLYVFLAMWFLKERNLAVRISISFAFVAIIYLVFGLFLKVPLPSASIF